ncbi:MAG TPA: hypothetical protein H9983_07775 [Candidatus Kurthia intestinigallinarum]|nr:hypothetical protein [Candidatus Kurthia intestinigallinarum]
MKRCPVCKTKLLEFELVDAYKIKCPNQCYEFADHIYGNGFYIRIGDKKMTDLYEHSIRVSRRQNLVLERWKQKARKQYSKGISWK